MPIEIVTEQPRVRVTHDYDLPASGSAHWDGSVWIITLNAAEHERRHRFSLMHEFKHIIDHPTRHLLQGDPRVGLTAEQTAEKVADYFAACVLMPKPWVKRAFCSETQSIERLAGKFKVSAQAMSFRLRQLGLTEAPNRCSSSTSASDPYGRSSQMKARYFRTRTAPPLEKLGAST